ncbi:MAG: hypothetical protein ACRCUT_13005, partial [Spirochaetota bacterium]
MRKIYITPILLILCFLCTTAVFADDEPRLDGNTLAVSAPSGSKGYIPLTIFIPDKSYIYGNPKGPGTGKPLVCDIMLPSGFSSGSPFIEKPAIYHPKGDNYVNIYKKEVHLYIPLSVPEETSAEPVIITLKGLMCNDSFCKPFELSKEISFTPGSISGMVSELPKGFIPLGSSMTLETKAEPAAPPAPRVKPAPLQTFTPKYLSRSVDGIIPAIFFGLLAGFLLNLMPCVLPVLSIKIISIVQNAHNRKQTLSSGLFYTAGILLSFSILASLSVFAGWGWGNLFQKPLFIIIMILFMFSLSLSLFGVYTLHVPGFAGRASVHTF